MAGSPKERRRWGAEAKRAICPEARAPGVSVAQVAQRHAVNANLIFEWLRDPRFAPGPMLEAAPVSLPVRLHDGGASGVAAEPAAAGRGGRVEIVLAGGHRLSTFGAFDGDAVARLSTVPVRSS